MTRIALSVAIFLLTMVPLRALAETETEPSNERSSAFVGGEIDPSEAFGPIEGPVFLVLGLAGLLLVFVFLAVSRKTQNNNQIELDRLAKQLLPQGDADVS